MRRNEHVSARVLTVAGLAATVAYLAWRAAFSMTGTAAWLSVPLFVVEVVGFLGALSLAWAMWPTRAERPDEHLIIARRVDAVVRVSDQFVHEVRATLLALQSVDAVAHLIIVDLSGRPAVASLATEFQAVYAATDTEDRNGLRVMAAAVRSPEFLLIDAGDVPSTDIVRRLSTGMKDVRVAVVQGLGVSLAEDSPEHGPNRRHELDFERTALNPALGRRGVAVWLGSGSLVRTDALRDVHFGDEVSLEAHWGATSDLHSAGWAIAAPGDVAVVSHRTITDDVAVYIDRVRRTRAARQMLIGRRGVLRPTNYTPHQRLAAIAWTVRPLSSVRRVVFIALLSAAMLLGVVPFHASKLTIAALWLPSFVYTSLGLALLSGWTLRPGDRTRWSLHNIGATVASFSNEVVPQPRARRRRFAALPSRQYGAGLIVAIITLSLVLALRGLSDRVTHTMGALPQQTLVAMVIVTLWLLTVSLDLVRVLARRAQLRRAQRVSAALSATLGERAVAVLDLTSLGAGVLSHTGLDIGEQMLLETAVPTRSGVTSVRIPVEVRNVSVVPTGEWRIGLEFGCVDDATANALAEYCLIEPTWEQLGSIPGTSVTEARPVMTPEPATVSAGAGRTAVRLVSLFALVGAIASSLPTPAEASEAPRHHWTGVVVGIDGADAAGVAKAVVTGICSTDAGADRQWGTVDDAYGAPVSTVTDEGGRYALDLVGSACWSYVAPPVGFSPTSGSFDEVSSIDLRGDLHSRTNVVRDPTGSIATAVTGAAVSDLIWDDQNGNGVHDGNEPGLAGVAVTLLDRAGHAIARQVTRTDGRFLFANIPAGKYRVTVSNLPTDLAFTVPSIGGDLVESAADVFTGRTPLVSIAPGTQQPVLEIGLRPTALTAHPHAASTAVFPTPQAQQVVDAGGAGSALSIVVLVIAAVLAGSLLIGLARPRRLSRAGS